MLSLKRNLTKGGEATNDREEAYLQERGTREL